MPEADPQCCLYDLTVKQVCTASFLKGSLGVGTSHAYNQVAFLKEYATSKA